MTRGWDPKGLREALCQQQVVAPYGRDRELMQELIDRLDLHRPLGSDGKHNNLHTPTCGCDDRGPTDRDSHRTDHAREWLRDTFGVSHPGDEPKMRDALLAVLDECDRADARIMLRGSMTSADVRDAINKALGISDE